MSAFGGKADNAAYDLVVLCEVFRDLCIGLAVPLFATGLGAHWAYSAGASGSKLPFSLRSIASIGPMEQ
jgi:hypothetical protein